MKISYFIFVLFLYLQFSENYCLELEDILDKLPKKGKKYYYIYTIVALYSPNLNITHYLKKDTDSQEKNCEMLHFKSLNYNGL